jgi:RNA polymerase sigma factor (sigma-70 family)
VATADPDLVRAWSAGDERAYEAIVNRYAPLVFNRCRRVLGDADADDATQAVFLVLAQKRDQAAASPVLAAWLMTVAGNVVRNAWRDRRRRRTAEAAMPPPQPSTTVEPTMSGIHEHLDACLAELPAREREAIILHHLAGRTLAEVSTQTRAGLSTVRYRIDRGLERLRSLLTARGVALSAVALAACLAGEAQAGVPPQVLAHLQAPAPSERVRRWSRQGTPRGIRVVALVGIFLGGAAAVLLLPPAEPPAAPVAAAAVEPAPVFSGNPLLDLDPEHARTWIVLRANDGARTVERLRAQPEMALLPRDGWATELATLREAALVIDEDSSQPAAERIRAYRLKQEAEGMDLEQRMGLLQTELARVFAAGPAATVAPVAPPAGAIPAFSGWIASTSADGPLLGRLRATLGGTPAVDGVRPVGDGWAFATASGDCAIAIAGDRIAITAPATAPPVPAAIADLMRKPLQPDAELEVCSYLDPGRPGLAAVRTMTGSLRIDADGPRFRSVSESFSTLPATAKPDLDRGRFDAVPATAIIAGAMAMRPNGHAPDLFARILAGIAAQIRLAEGDAMPPEVPAVLGAIGLLLDRTDGALIAWLEPDTFLPSVTFAADLDRADAEAIIAATGLARAADGSVTAQAGPVAVALGWRDGRLVATTNSAGLASLDRHGGFTAHPEIRRALAAMPADGVNACVLVRPAAVLDLALPFGMMLVPRLQQQLMDYQAALTAGRGYGYLIMADDGRRQTLEAGGALALLGCAILAGQAVDPAMQMRVPN